MGLFYHKNTRVRETVDHGLQVLKNVLEKYYDKDHEVIIYQASHLPLCQPSIQQVALANIQDAIITASSTMYIPPQGEQIQDENVIRELGMVRIRND